MAELSSREMGAPSETKRKIEAHIRLNEQVIRVFTSGKLPEGNEIFNHPELKVVLDHVDGEGGIGRPVPMGKKWRRAFAIASLGTTLLMDKTQSVWRDPILSRRVPSYGALVRYSKGDPITTIIADLQTYNNRGKEKITMLNRLIEKEKRH